MFFDVLPMKTELLKMARMFSFNKNDFYLYFEHFFRREGNFKSLDFVNISHQLYYR